MVIVSDVDGTLLTDDGICPYPDEWLAAVAQQHDVILASSRTGPELAALQRQFGWSGPYIAEDGHLIGDIDGKVELLGASVAELHRLIATTHHAAAITQLLLDNPLASRDRQASLLLPYQAADADLVAALAEVGLVVSVGGRWATVTMGGGKGGAVRHLMSARGVTQWAAIGNAANDRSLLDSASSAFIIRNADGHDPVLLELPDAVRLTRSGPWGWQEMLNLLVADSPHGTAERRANE